MHKPFLGDSSASKILKTFQEPFKKKVCHVVVLDGYEDDSDDDDTRLLDIYFRGSWADRMHSIMTMFKGKTAARLTLTAEVGRVFKGIEVKPTNDEKFYSNCVIIESHSIHSSKKYFINIKS